MLTNFNSQLRCVLEQIRKKVAQKISLFNESLYYSEQRNDRIRGYHFTGHSANFVIAVQIS